MLTIGLRLGEGLGLTWADIDFKKSELYVREALTFKVETDAQGKRHRVPVMGPPKTELKVPLPIGPQLLVSLRAHRTAQEKRAERYSGHYLRTPQGEPVYVFANGVPIPTISERFGHSNQTTTEYYVDPNPERQREATLILEGALFGG